MGVLRSLRLWLTMAVMVALLLWAWIASHRKPNSKTNPEITDLSVTSPLNQPGGGTAPAEAYEIYSALYQTPQQEPLAFSAESVADIPQLNGNCLKPVTTEEQEMTEAFVSANRQSRRWEQKFSIPAGYQLLPRRETDIALKCLDLHGQDTDLCKSYKQLIHVRFLGIPGFDHAHTKALVSVIKKCGGFCGSGGIFVVEKTGSSWRRSQTTDFTSECNWMY